MAGDLNQVLFVESGFGCDQHGQNSTKAVVRACRNAIEFNSIPSVERLVPGGRNGLKLKIKIGTPFPDTVDLQEVKKVFPYGETFFEEDPQGQRELRLANSLYQIYTWQECIKASCRL
ncbi:hypothetical protein WJX77_011425 [Trebouxia sp. C0004]